MFTETISILTSVYNTKEFLPRYFQCILGQSYENLEIIIVDDGSTDGSGELCDEYAKKDKRIKVYHMEHLGILKARALCHEKSTGDYIGWADADDWVEPDLFEYLYNLINKYDADLAQCGYYEHRKNKTIIRSCPKEEMLAIPPFNKEQWELFSTVYWNKLFRRNVFPKYIVNEDYCTGEDDIHGTLAYKKSKKIVFGNLPKYHYLYNDNSITHNNDFDRLKLICSFTCDEFLKELLKDEPEGLKHRRSLLIPTAFGIYYRITKNNLDCYDDIKAIVRNTFRKNLFYTLFLSKLSLKEKLLAFIIILGDKPYLFLRKAFRKLIGRE